MKMTLSRETLEGLRIKGINQAWGQVHWYLFKVHLSKNYEVLVLKCYFLEKSMYLTFFKYLIVLPVLVSTCKYFEVHV